LVQHQEPAGVYQYYPASGRGGKKERGEGRNVFGKRYAHYRKRFYTRLELNAGYRGSDSGSSG